MLIGIDGNEANVEKRVGVNVYAFDLLRTLYDLAPEWKNKHHLIVYLRNEPLSDMPKETDFFKYKILPGRGLWILTKLTPYLFLTNEKPDVLFSPSHYVPLISPIPRICSIMDLGYLEFSEQFKKTDYWQLKYWSAISIFVSKVVLTISDSSKKDIVRHYPFAAKKIFVTHLGYDRGRFNKDISEGDVRRIKNKYSIVGDYILFVSTLKPSKNIERLLEAFRLVANRLQTTDNIKAVDLRLVIAGKKGWMYDRIFKEVKRLKLEDRVIFTDYLPEQEKPALMAGAKMLVLPSFWEGFGHDPLQAMAVGTPVVVSNAGSLPEVVGKAGIYIDPYSPDSIAGGIFKVLTMSEIEYNKLVGKGYMQAEKFSWEKTARKTLEILESAAKK